MTIYKPKFVKVRPKTLKDKKIARELNAILDWQMSENYVIPKLWCAKYEGKE